MLNQVNFIHLNKHHLEWHGPKGTVATVLPSKAQLENAFEKHAVAIMLYLGATKLHPRYQFNKAEGRKQSEERLSLQVLYLESVEMRGTKHVYHFVAHVPNFAKKQKKFQELMLGLTTSAESEKVYLTYAIFGNDTDKESPRDTGMAPSELDSQSNTGENL